MENIAEELEKIVNKNNILINESMKKHTSFKIGGNADFFVKVQTVEQLKNILELVQKKELPYLIIGNGTNLLVREGGIRGIVIKLEFKEYTIKFKEDYAFINAGSGITLAYLAHVALENGLTGLENLSGIPGTVGGAIRMNAGAYGSEMKDIVVSSKCMNINGEIKSLTLDEHCFDYRKSVFEENELIILETTIKLKIGNKSEIERKMNECKKARQEKQPIDLPNAGSIFKKNDAIPIAKLIEECGLKGYSIGDAQISTKHSGFIVNNGNAISEDVLKLIELIKNKVKEKFKVDVKLEIIVIGEE